MIENRPLFRPEAVQAQNQQWLGGEIGIHGGGSGKNWTLGCVALDAPDIKELFEQLPLGTVVEIRP